MTAAATTPTPAESLLTACAVCGGRERPHDLILVVEGTTERWLHPACAVEDTRRLAAG